MRGGAPHVCVYSFSTASSSIDSISGMSSAGTSSAGSGEIKKVHKEIVFCPAQQAETPYADTLFFSAENGFTDAENIDAERIIIRAEYQKPTVAKADNEKRKKDAVEPSQIVYNTPGYACVRVYFKGEELNKRTMPIAQLGIDVPLSKDLFTGNQLPVIVFSEQTGNIVSISKWKKSS